MMKSAANKEGRHGGTTEYRFRIKGNNRKLAGHLKETYEMLAGEAYFMCFAPLFW